MRRCEDKAGAIFTAAGGDQDRAVGVGPGCSRVREDDWPEMLDDHCNWLTGAKLVTCFHYCYSLSNRQIRSEECVSWHITSA